MTNAQLKDVGLTDEGAVIYGSLLDTGAQTAGELLSRLKTIKRPTLYKELRRLKDAKLVSESDRDGIILFSPLSPDALLDAADEELREADERRAKIAAIIPELKRKYVLTSERPMFRFYEGPEGLKEIYERQLEIGGEVLSIRTHRAKVYDDLFGKWWAHYLRRRNEHGIKVMAITPDDASSNHDTSIDKARHFFRTWIRPSDYTSNVEFMAFGDIIAIISYGKEVFVVTIENAEVAKGFKEIFTLARRGAETIEVKHDHQSRASRFQGYQPR